MHEFWTILIANMTYTRLQNYTNIMVDEHGIQTFIVVVVACVFIIWCFCPPQVHVPYYFYTNGLSKSI